MFRRTLVLAIYISLSACSTQTPISPNPGVLQSRLAAQQTAVNSLAAPDSPPLRLHIKRAEIEISTHELNQQLLHILKFSDEKRIRNPLLTTETGNSMQVKGRVKAASLLPEVSFAVTGELQARPGNTVRFHPTDIRVVGIPFKGLMDILGLELASLAKFKDQWGRVVQSGNDIDLIIQKFTSDAIIEGQIQQITTGPEGISVIF